MAPSHASPSRITKAGLLGVLLLPAAALAQFKCTMPSGVVIFNRLSACPADAVKSEPLDREPPPPAPPRAKLAERDIISEANGICAMLKMGGATTCEIDVNIFSASVIDATVATTPNDAPTRFAICWARVATQNVFTTWCRHPAHRTGVGPPVARRWINNKSMKSLSVFSPAMFTQSRPLR